MSSDDAVNLAASVDEPSRFTVIFERHHRSVWAYLARSGGVEKADELTAQVFEVAFRRLASFDPAVGDARAWLFGIGRNLLRSSARGAARGRRAWGRVAQQRDGSVDVAGGVVDARDASTTVQLVLAAMGRLSTEDRELLTLAAWEKLSYREIAAVLSVPEGTVRSRLSRARGRLRELLVASGQVEAMTSDEGPVP